MPCPTSSNSYLLRHVAKQPVQLIDKVQQLSARALKWHAKKDPAKWSNKLTCNWAQLINVQHTHTHTGISDLWRKHNGQLPALVPRPLGCTVNCSACKCHNGSEGESRGEETLCHAGHAGVDVLLLWSSERGCTRA